VPPGRAYFFGAADIHRERRVLAQSAGFALLAAVSPTALLVMAVFLASSNPRLTALMYVAGAVVMTTAMAVTVLLVLRAAGLDQPRQHDPRYALRLALGVLALGLAVFVASRGRRAPAADPVTVPVAGAAAAGAAHAASNAAASGGAGQGIGTTEGARKRARPGIMARLTTNPSPLTAFLAGLLLFAPSATFIAAVQVIATAREGIPVTVAAMLIVIALTALIVWLPLLGYLAAPDATTRVLGKANGWIRAHGRKLLALALWVGGIALVVDGALGLKH
jgi:hypothetical protein